MSPASKKKAPRVVLFFYFLISVLYHVFTVSKISKREFCTRKRGALFTHEQPYPVEKEVGVALYYTVRSSSLRSKPLK